MRKGFDTLCAMVQETLKEDPFSGQLFVFRGKQGERVKILWWCDGGLCLFYRRLEEASSYGLVRRAEWCLCRRLNSRCCSRGLIGEGRCALPRFEQ